MITCIQKLMTCESEYFVATVDLDAGVLKLDRKDDPNTGEPLEITENEWADFKELIDHLHSLL